jgi:hypothetical protein
LANSIPLALLATFTGMYVAGAPAYLAFFPPQPADPTSARRVLFIGWLAGAALIAAIALIHDREAQHVSRLVHRLIPGAEARAERFREATARCIAALLDPGANGMPDPFRLGAFVPDPGDSAALVPLYEDEPERWQHWAPGQGLVGAVWKARDSGGNLYTVMDETLIAQTDMHLSDEQARRYAGLKLLAATLIRSDAGKPIGVLAVTCYESDPFGAHHIRAPPGDRQ